MAALATRSREFGKRIAMKRSRVKNVVLIHRRVEHRKTFMVLRRDDHVFHARVLGPSASIDQHQIWRL